MRNSARKLLPLTAGILLALGGAVFAGDNAGVTLSLSADEFSGVAAGDQISVTVSASGLVEVKNVSITLRFPDPSAFNITFDNASIENSNIWFVPNEAIDALAGFSPTSLTDVSSGGNTLLQGGGGAFPTDDPMNGDADLGTFFITMADDYDGSEVSVEVFESIIGKNSSDQDTQTSDQIALSITINPPAPAPTASAIAPAQGSITGGTALTITGANFQDGATVTIGGVDAGAAFVDATSLTATSPAGEEGDPLDVVITNSDGQSVTLAAAFTYLGIIEPTFTLLTPSDVSLDFSPVGSGAEADGSAGEHSPYVNFTDATGAAAGSQEITWTFTNNGAETVYVIDQADGSVIEIGVGGTETTTAITNDEGKAAFVGEAPSGSGTSLVDAEGNKSAGSTSLVAVASTTADNSEGETRELSVEITITWDVPVAAELASFVADFKLSNEVLLEWAVASQTNNLGWEVYRSEDNRQFGKVGDLIFGDGTIDEYKIYSFTDGNLPQVGALYYYLKQIDLDGTVTRSDVIEILVAPTAVEQRVLPTVTTLLQNYPNPFNPETNISFDLSEEAVVSLTIYDLTGQVIRTLVSSQSMAVGHYDIVWNGQNTTGAKVGSGVYFYQLSAGNYVAKKKMTLLQ
jgi:hypothetical protein